MCFGTLAGITASLFLCCTAFAQQTSVTVATSNFAPVFGQQFTLTAMV